jgi:hypothetical protein
LPRETRDKYRKQIEDNKMTVFAGVDEVITLSTLKMSRGTKIRSFFSDTILQ